MRVAVLGAGLQGAAVAMELAGHGIRVDLYDKSDRCVSRTSAQNEGKIHLGYVYANDRSLATARTLIRGALSFAPLLRRWVGRAIDTVPVSVPFHYAVHRDSLLSPDEVERHLRASHAIVLEVGQGAIPDYFGSDCRQAPVRMSEAACERWFDRRTVAASFATSEIGIDPEALAAVVRARLSADPNIRCVLRTHVHRAAPDDRGVTIEFETDGVRARERYDHVVNALWDGRLAVDRTAGIEPPRPWLYRIRHNLRLRAPGPGARIPSATVILGPFGDVVKYDGGHLFLSWYPTGMRGLSSDISPPAWPMALDATAATEVRRSILAGLAGIIPTVAGLTPEAVESCRVTAGIIVAWGETDIQDPASALHQRHLIGPQSRGRYHTIDTGKLTVAPLFAKAVADAIRAGSAPRRAQATPGSAWA